MGGSEFFRRLDDLEKVFFTGVMEGANTEMEAFVQNQDMTIADNDTNKAKFLGNRDEMHQACTNFSEAHMTVIQNKEDYLQNQMNNWRTSFFERHRERQYHRNRQRIMDTKRVIDDCRAEINSAVEAGDEYDEHENGGDPYGR